MRIKPWSLAALLALAGAGLAPARAHAGNVVNFDLGSSSISGNFGTTQSIRCADGHSSTLFTFLSWNAFQGKERDKNVVTMSTNAGVFVQQNNGCTGETTFDGAFVQSGFTLTVNGVQSATLAGTIPLFSGRSLTMNLTISQTGSVFQGAQQYAQQRRTHDVHPAVDRLVLRREQRLRNLLTQRAEHPARQSQRRGRQHLQ